MIDVLKAAFLQGRLTKDEFDLRIGQLLAIYTELDTLTADIPAGLTAAQPPEPARKPDDKRLIQRWTAAGAGAAMVLGAAMVMPRNPVLGLAAGALIGSFTAVLLAGLLTLLSWVIEKGSSGQPSGGATTRRKR